MLVKWRWPMVPHHDVCQFLGSCLDLRVMAFSSNSLFWLKVRLLVALLLFGTVTPCWICSEQPKSRKRRCYVLAMVVAAHELIS
jgi:hypothetical protein